MLNRTFKVDSPIDIATQREPLLPTQPLAFLRKFVTGKILASFITVLVLSAFCTVIEQYTYIYNGRLIDAAQNNPEMLYLTMGIFLALNLGFRLSYRVIDWFDAFIPYFAWLRRAIQYHLFEWTLHHSSHFFSSHYSGELVSRVNRCAQESTHLLWILSYGASRFLFQLVTACLFLSHYSWVFSAIILCWVPLYALGSIRVSKEVYRCSAEQARSSFKVSAQISDVFSNIFAVKGWAAEHRERDRVSEYLMTEQNSQQAYRWSLFYFRLVQNIAYISLLILLMGWSSYLFTQGLITVGSLAAIIALSFHVTSIILSVTSDVIDFIDRSSILQHSLEELLVPHDVITNTGLVSSNESSSDPMLVKDRGGVIFDQVSFGYPDGDLIFKDFSLKINQGEKVGVVGHTGSGKSTLMKLLSRDFNLVDGRILLGGQDVKELSLSEVRGQLNHVPQQAELFHRTIAENIRYSKPEATMEEVITAAQRARCYDFIMKKENQWDSVVGERGAMLSGGERQRILIARAFLSQADVLVLDEATSALDSESERYIQSALLELMEGKTVIAIAHRLSTLIHMDRIVVLDQGQVVEQGTHAELLEKNGFYAMLWNHQSGIFLED